jgi:hypothetical protein
MPIGPRWMFRDDLEEGVRQAPLGVIALPSAFGLDMNVLPPPMVRQRSLPVAAATADAPYLPSSTPARQRRGSAAWVVSVTVFVVMATFLATLFLLGGRDPSSSPPLLRTAGYSFVATFVVTTDATIPSVRRVGYMSAVAATHLACVDPQTRRIYVVDGESDAPTGTISAYDARVDDRGMLYLVLQLTPAHAPTSCTLIVSMN